VQTANRRQKEKERLRQSESAYIANPAAGRGDIRSFN
jgi:hypothetical protein